MSISKAAAKHLHELNLSHFAKVHVVSVCRTRYGYLIVAISPFCNKVAINKKLYRLLTVVRWGTFWSQEFSGFFDENVRGTEAMVGWSLAWRIDRCKRKSWTEKNWVLIYRPIDYTKVALKINRPWSEIWFHLAPFNFTIQYLCSDVPQVTTTNGRKMDQIIHCA